MPRLLLSLLIAIIALNAPSVSADDFNYPDINAFLSTIGGTPKPLSTPVPEASSIRQSDLSVSVLPDRDLPPVLSRYRDLHFRLAWHNQPAPLLFLLAGTGSGYDSSRMDYLKALFWQAGMHVIVLSSPTNHDFIAAASYSGRPGLGREDARDLHTAMSMAAERARVTKGIEITEYRLAGFSLGALNAAFVSELDQSLGQFNFSRVLMLNPPVDLYNSVRRLDSLSDTRIEGISNTENFYEHIFNKLSQYYAETGDTDIERGLFEGIQGSDQAFSEAELALLIGAVFRFAAADLNFMADLINKTGRYAPADKPLWVSTSLTPYLRRALFCDFECYLQNQLFPEWQSRNAGKTIDDMAWETSLRSISGHLKNNPNFAVISNADDFILNQADYQFLIDTFGEQAHLFPRGGHGGNLQHSQVTSTMLDFLTERAQ
jgi:hypothetical protein